MIELELPWPPSVNHYWQPRARLPSIQKLASAPSDPRRLYHWLNGKVHGYKYMPKSALDWRNVAVNIIKRKYPGRRPDVGLLQCVLNLYPPNAATDFDNYNKPIFDAIEHAACIYENDRQIRACLIVVNNIVPGGRVRLTITKLGA